MNAQKRDTKIATWLDLIPILATLLVAAAAALLAAHATHDVAVTSGAVIDPTQAWCLPVIIEGSAVTAGLLRWRRERAGQSAHAEQAALIVMMLLATIVNASHAWSGTWLGVLLAACPPLVVVASIELLLRSHDAVEAGQVEAAERERMEWLERERLEAVERERAGRRSGSAHRERGVGGLSVTPMSAHRAADAQSAARPVPPAERPGIIRAMYAEGLAVNEKTVMERLGLSRAAAGREIRKARDEREVG